MDRRRFLLTSLAGALAAPLAGSAQPATRVYRIGWMNTASAGWHDSAFREGLRELGYVEGRNIVTEWRWVEGKFELLPGVAAQLINLKVDIILAGGTPAALAAQKATTTTPIVMVVAADPVAAGLVTSLARPTGNVTGITRISPELAGKRLELLKETLPKLSRLAILWHDASNLLPRVRVPLLICPITSTAWDDQTQRLVKPLLGAL